MTARRRVLLLLLALLPGAWLAARQAFGNWPFFSDDSFISLRFSQRLLEGHGLTWTAGERVEGYSNLLWVLATAAVGACGLDLVTAARALGGGCTLLAQCCLVRAVPPHDLASTLRAAAGPLLVAAAAPVMTWTLGGLEGPMVLLWLAWGGCRLVRLADDDVPGPGALRAAGLPFALLCLTRPDGPLWTAAVAVALGVAALRGGLLLGVTRALWFALLPIAATIGQLCFRWFYYRDIVPNTAHVKLDLDGKAMQAGLEYVGQGLVVLIGLVVPALLGALLALRQRRLRVVVAALVGMSAAWLAYLISIGGDHFPGYRLWHGLLAPLALLAVLGLAAAPGRICIAFAAVLAAGVRESLWHSYNDSLSVYPRSETWEWDAKEIGLALRSAFGPAAPRIAVDAAGALPYYSRLPALDMLGLCDRTIATSPPPTFAAKMVAARGKGLAGHMRGNGRYVMDCAPDLVLFNHAPGMPLAVFFSALDFEADPRWLDGYRCVVVQLEPPRKLVLPLWVKVDGKAGVQREPDRIEVPAMLLGAYRQPCAFRLGYDQAPRGSPEELELQHAYFWFTRDCFVVAKPAADGTFELELQKAQPAALSFDVPPGRWRLQPDRDAPIDLVLRGAAVVAADGGFTVGGDGPQRVELVATPRADAALPLLLRTVTLQRQR